MILKPRSGHL